MCRTLREDLDEIHDQTMSLSTSQMVLASYDMISYYRAIICYNMLQYAIICCNIVEYNKLWYAIIWYQCLMMWKSVYLCLMLSSCVLLSVCSLNAVRSILHAGLPSKVSHWRNEWIWSRSPMASPTTVPSLLLLTQPTKCNERARSQQYWRNETPHT